MNIALKYEFMLILSFLAPTPQICAQSEYLASYTLVLSVINRTLFPNTLI